MKIFVHIGYPKTGTSFLQRDFFPVLPGIQYLGIDYPRELPSNHQLSGIAEELQLRRGSACRHLLARAETVLSGARGRRCNETPLVFSEEGIAACALRPSAPLHGDLGSITRAVERLRSLFAQIGIHDFCVVVTLRCQASLVKSLYSEYALAYRDFLRLRKPDAWLDYVLASGDESRLGLVLRYDQLLSQLRRCCGENNVILWFFEDFTADQLRFLTVARHDLTGTWRPVTDLGIRPSARVNRRALEGGARIVTRHEFPVPWARNLKRKLLGGQRIPGTNLLKCALRSRMSDEIVHFDEARVERVRIKYQFSNERLQALLSRALPKGYC